MKLDPPLDSIKSVTRHGSNSSAKSMVPTSALHGSRISVDRFLHPPASPPPARRRHRLAPMCSSKQNSDSHRPQQKYCQFHQKILLIPAKNATVSLVVAKISPVLGKNIVGRSKTISPAGRFQHRSIVVAASHPAGSSKLPLRSQLHERVVAAPSPAGRSSTNEGLHLPSRPVPAPLTGVVAFAPPVVASQPVPAPVCSTSGPNSEHHQLQHLAERP